MTNPFLDLLKNWPATANKPAAPRATQDQSAEFAPAQSGFYAGTTSIEAADTEGWAVSVTPSGGWMPAVIAGHSGVGLSQRAQSFVLDPAEAPLNVIEPGKRARGALTPTLRF